MAIFGRRGEGTHGATRTTRTRPRVQKHKDNNTTTNNNNRNKEHALQVHTKKLAENLFEFERGKCAREGPTLYS